MMDLCCQMEPASAELTHLAPAAKLWDANEWVFEWTIMMLLAASVDRDGGWRPHTAENLNIIKRSLIVIFNLRDTMKPYYQTFLANINSTVNTLTAAPNNTIVRYTIVTFITHLTTGTNSSVPFSFESFPDFYAKLVDIGNQFVHSDSPYQDIVNTLLMAQQTNANRDNTPFSQVWLFADSLPTTDFPEDTTVANGNVEHKLIQLAVDFRTKACLETKNIYYYS
ncbi:hypothetical protein WR25_06868 [Diploscapter pachys]|uniref:Uncharacterized protein n=1 Tax=Diploscapter pachys TaxID=2018661 RepID=A0A2A2JNG2_9BILA|nr:hypothetical protein WR25_06868 [Diploscapter pachys]